MSSSNNSPDESIYLRYVEPFLVMSVDLNCIDLLEISPNSIQSIASLNDDVFKNRNFATQLVDVLKHTLDNGELIDIELVAGSDNKR